MILEEFDRRISSWIASAMFEEFLGLSLSRLLFSQHVLLQLSRAVATPAVTQLLQSSQVAVLQVAVQRLLL